MLYNTQNPHGGDIYKEKINIDFSVNINPLGTPKAVTDAIKKSLPEIYHYPDPYCRKLVGAISAHEDVAAECVLCGNGAAELIYAYCEAVKPDIAVEVAPTFSEYSSALEKVGCKVNRYELNENNEFELDEKFIEYLEQFNPDVVFICNPNNPTGKTVSISLMNKILRYCSKRNARLFVDECFSDLSDNCISVKEYLAGYPQLFILKAFTKSYGMAGVRLGYGLSADTDLLMKMSRVTQPWNVSLLAQVAGVEALAECEFLKNAREIISAERTWMKSELERLGLWVCPSDANFMLIYGIENLDTELIKYGIAIRNCNNFYGLTDGWYRIAVKLHEENETLINAIRQIYEKR